MLDKTPISINAEKGKYDMQIPHAMTKSKINFSLWPKCTLIRQIFLKRQKKERTSIIATEAQSVINPYLVTFSHLARGRGGGREKAFSHGVNRGK